MCFKVQNEVEKLFYIFGQNYGLTPLENLPISENITCMFSESRKDCFFSGQHRETLFNCVLKSKSKY